MLQRNEQPVSIPVDANLFISGDLSIPDNFRGIVLFAHGSGSSRHSPRNRFVARELQQAGLGTLLLDLLTEDEEAIDEQTAHLRFDIDFLADRLVTATDWLVRHFDVSDGDNITGIGYFGASTGAAAALVAATKRADIVKAIVSRGGRPDLAGDYLLQVRAPTLLLVGGDDGPVIGLNEEAYGKLRLLKDEEKKLTVISGATHLFEEPGKLEQVAKFAAGWFSCFLASHRNRNKSAEATQ
jgi:dienelactone hydrolase